jgi:hypothetical protein
MNHPGRVAKLADAADLGSAAARHRGSSPLPCTDSEKPTPSRSDETATEPAPQMPWGTDGALKMDSVDAALAKALDAAAVAGRFDVVSQLAKELEARRLARSPNVVTIASRRDRR